MAIVSFTRKVSDHLVAGYRKLRFLLPQGNITNRQRAKGESVNHFDLNIPGVIHYKTGRQRDACTDQFEYRAVSNCASTKICMPLGYLPYRDITTIGLRHQEWYRSSKATMLGIRILQ